MWFHREIHYATDMNVACPLCRSGDTFVLQITEPLTDSDPLVSTTFISVGDVLKFVAYELYNVFTR